MDKAYKKYSQHDHGRAVAAKRYEKGGAVGGKDYASMANEQRRAAGGKVMTAGAKSGVGRLQKAGK